MNLGRVLPCLKLSIQKQDTVTNGRVKPENAPYKPAILWFATTSSRRKSDGSDLQKATNFQDVLAII